MKERGFILILLFIILVLFGILFLRKSGIFTINQREKSTPETPNNYYNTLNPSGNKLPNVKETVESIHP